VGRAHLQQAGAALFDGELCGAGAGRHVSVWGRTLGEARARREDGSSSAQGDAMSGRAWLTWVLDLLVLKKGTHACVRHVTGSRVLI